MASVLRTVCLTLSLSAALTSAGQARPTYFHNATVLTADDDPARHDAAFIIDNGRFVAIGEALPPPGDAEIVDLQGAVVTPGFVVSYSNLGLVEVGSRANANDASAAPKTISAAIDVQYAIDTRSSLFPIARTGGVTRAIVAPSPAGRSDGELRFGGQPAAVSTGPGPAQIVAGNLGVTLDISGSAGGRTAVFPQLLAVLADVKRHAETPTQFASQQIFARSWSPADLQALEPVATGKLPLIAIVNRASDILAMLDVQKKTGIKLIFVGAAEGWKVAEAIAEAGVPVLLDPAENLPRSFDVLGASHDNPRLLHEAGVTIAIAGPRAGHDARLVRILAGVAVANGLDRNTALRAITVNPSRIWRQAASGQIAVGQTADFAIWSGDPFEPMTRLEALYVGGRKVSLQTRQTALQNKYTPSSSAEATQRSGEE